MEKAIFFPSIGGDRKYNAQDLADTIGGLVTNGVYSKTAINLKAEAAEGMNITLQPGLCVINGRVGINKNPVTLTVDAADGVLHRIDRVMLRCDYNEREIAEYIKKGTPASAPSAPALQRDADAYEISVANIAVNAGTAAITQFMITDTRASGDLCGYVDFAANPGLQGLFSEMQAQINTLLAELDLGNLPASAVTTGVFDAARLPGASTSTAGITRLNSALDSTLETQAATPKAVKAVNDKADAIKNNLNAVGTAAGGPVFTLTKPEWASGIPVYTPLLILFNGNIENATLKINGIGPFAIVNAYGGNFKGKAGFYTMVFNGTNFFVVSPGGGIDVPDTIQAGETIVYSKTDTVITATAPGYTDVAGYGVTCIKAGTYRIKFYVSGQNPGNYYYGRLTKNGAEIAGSQITVYGSPGGLKTIDVALAVGDVVRLQVMERQSVSNLFTVSILIPDVGIYASSLITGI